MEQLYCMNCLGQIPAYPCPLCGYDPSQSPRISQALEQSILRGRYLTGRVLEKNSIEIVYRGLDLVENRPVTLWEFFPGSQAERLENGHLKWNSPAGENEQTILSRLRQRLPQEAVLDSFSENSTVYIVCKPAAQRPVPVQHPKKENEWIPILFALVVLALTALTAAALYVSFGSYLGS